MNKALVIYDSTGKIWNIAYGDVTAPQGLLYLYVDIPTDAELLRIDVTDAKNPKPVFNYAPETDLGKLQKEVAGLTERLDEVAPEAKDPETLDEWKTYKKAEVSKVCENTIYNGVDVAIGEGTKHFSLTEKDQLNLFGVQVQISAGAETIEYHADGEPCIYYPVADMKTVVAAAMKFVSYHRTYCNSMYIWIKACESVEDVQKITYGVDIPAEYQSDVLKSYLVEMSANETA